MRKLYFLMIMLLTALTMSAQTTNIRYVSKSGAYANDGKSWATPKLNIQDAINDLVNNHLTGEVWVAAGEYTPTESTEASGGSTLYMSFKIPEGITVRGGFRGKVEADPGHGIEAYAGETSADQREMKKYASIGDFYLHKTVLSGNLSSTCKFKWNADKEQWETTYYGNTYHVVWFATKGFDPETGRANPISTTKQDAAKLEGCVVTGGNAHNNTVSGRTHNAYGGGIYMVPGACVENCWIYNCSASRDGGGVYMDGGGYFEHCYVQDCQALGIGVQNGFGGGICVDGIEKAISNSTPYWQTNPVGFVTRTGITGCVGRMGGGLAFNTHDVRLKYNIIASAVLVGNNTAVTEGGGVYVNKGAALTQMTVVNNKCNGTGVTVGGMQTGRSAGIYVRDNAHVVNSLLWGGKVSANNDIQYASSRSASDDNLKPLMQFTMLSKADHVDWSGTQKYKVEKLSDFNNLSAFEAAKLLNPELQKVESESFPVFVHPSDSAGHMQFAGLQTITSLTAQGVPTDANDAPRKAFDWKVDSRSAATHRGVLTYDLDTKHETPAQPSTHDILGDLYTARVTLGAYNSEAVSGLPYMYAEKNGTRYVYDFATGKFVDGSGTDHTSEINDTWTVAANIFIDPNETDAQVSPTTAHSWDTPFKFLPDVLHYVKSMWDDSKYDKYFGLVNEINVCVKEGIVNNTSSHYTGHVRNATIEIPHLKRKNGKKVQLNVLGGFSGDLMGTDMSRRDPVHHPTIITGDIMDDYEMNASHLVTFNGCHDVLFDGFQLRYGNAKSTALDNTDQNGAAMYFKENIPIAGDECNEPGSMAYKCCRIDVKNVLVAGCTAVNGAAVYAIDNSQVNFENCIFHNNQAGNMSTKTDGSEVVPNGDTNGIVYASSGSSITLNHCDVLRNVGFAYAGQGAITLNNSVTYANMNRVTEDTNDNGSDALKPMTTSTTLAGSNNLFDIQAGDMGSVGTNTLNFHFDSNTGGENYPRFINPTKNAGVSPKGDVTYYGRATSFEPTNTNPMVNAASTADPDHSTWGKDMSNNTTRDFGGRPDIGAIENHMATALEASIDENANQNGQMPYGSLTYVRDYTATGSTQIETYDKDGSGNLTKNASGLGLYNKEGHELDGSSWEYAINGNATYGNRTININYTPVILDGFYIKNGTDYVYYNTEGHNWKFTKDKAQATVFTIGGVTTAGATISNGTHTITAQVAGNPQFKIWSTHDWLIVNINWQYYFYEPSSGNNKTSVDPYFQMNNGKYQLKYSNSANYFVNKNGDEINIGTNGNAATALWEFEEKTHLGATVHEEVIVNGNNGLQFAVDLAQAYLNLGTDLRDGNTYHPLPVGKEDAQVWVGAGVYTNPVGFTIKDHVKVYGAFPKTGNPGMSERHPQLTTDVALSAENAVGKDASQQAEFISNYETILQTSPTKGQTSINKSVLSQPDECKTTTADNQNTSRNHTVFEGAEWDGFTIRYGYKTGVTTSRTSTGRRNGGAGIAMWEGVIIRNCIVRDNILGGNTSYYGRGGGVYCDGSSVINCYVLDNKAQCGSGENYGGGIYMIRGTLYNTVIAGNSVTGNNDENAAGIFIENANFYNNTIVNNTGAPAIGMYTSSYQGAPAELNVYNTVVIAPAGQRVLRRTATDLPVHFVNCYLQQSTGLTSNGEKNNVTVAMRTDCIVGPTDYNAATPFAKSYSTAVSTYDYRIEAKNNSYNCVNVGTDQLGGIDLPDNDMDYAERIQDCTVDIGAYEFNGAYSITPDVTTVSGQAIYYVTPNGVASGNASADSPANAACADKLQKILDAAGRYKFAHPSAKVIVKVANSFSMQADNSPFYYQAARTTDHSDQNARIWSIIVPHGVEVWGGYTDVNPSTGSSSGWSNTPGTNGFYRAATAEDVAAGLAASVGNSVDARDITANPTYFNGVYENKQEGTTAQSYHTVTFCDRVYDVDGHPYLKTNVDAATGTLETLSTFDKNNPPAEDGYLHMSDVSVISGEETRNQHRAVIDGIFVSGGNANADEGSSELLSVGGAAVVTDFAHVRNCIILNNNAKKGGGLAVANRGLVSGTLIVNNTAELGGGIYSIPNGVKLANGTTNDTDKPEGKTMDWNMPHVFTSTIVGNSATKQGGGIYYSNENPNVRVNSCVIWNNDAPDQANVAGIVSPDKPLKDTNSTLAFYPFGYTAIQNLRATGTNNIKVEAEESRGVRWADLNTDPYYGITDYSVLTRTGMPVNDYDALVAYYDISATDYAKLDRKIQTYGGRSFIDIGARAVDKVIVKGELMLRLFVAMPEDIDMTKAEKMMALANTPKPADSAPQADKDAYATKIYYAQEGSSFAYPMNNLQQALDYIYSARSMNAAGTALNYADANNLPFEIVVAKGHYYPTRDLAGNYGQSIANTFLIPEGVSIVGGFDSKGGKTEDGRKQYFGRYNRKGTIQPATDNYENGSTTPTYYISGNVTSVTDGEKLDIADGITIVQAPLDMLKTKRDKADVNANNIIEPWEFLNETVLDGNAVNAENTGVYHVLTAVADQNLVGMLPTRSIDRKGVHYEDDGITPVAGYQWFDREEGQSINLNGLTVTGGDAHKFTPNALDEMSLYSYYHGGAFLIDGNRYDDNYNKADSDPGHITYDKDPITNKDIVRAAYLHTGVSNAVGYRDIPVAISQCKFVNNTAGYGGAISTNTTVDIFNSSFEQNLANSGWEEIDYNGTKTVAYPGQGGAVYSTHQFSAFNTIFANNEARFTKGHGQNKTADEIVANTFPTLRNQTPTTQILGGVGGAIYTGIKGQFHLVNCNIVRNMANAYPAVFTMNPNHSGQVIPQITTPMYNQMVNTVIWGNEVNKTMQTKFFSNPRFKFASQLVCNYGRADRWQGGTLYDYVPSFAEDAVPANQQELDEETVKGNPTYEETVWFSAYEEGRGITQNNTYDFRDIDYLPYVHGKIQIGNYAMAEFDAESAAEKYQNCNVSIAKENDVLEGPNFINPSVEAGVAGYLESADWSPARLNKMTDNGTGKIRQIIEAKGETYTSKFPTYTEAHESIPYVRGDYSIETNDDVITHGAYTMTRFLSDYKHYNDNLPLGDDYYMESANSSHQQLLRISYDPNPTHNQTYIDIGVYEYPHTELMYHTEDECDILWVSAAEKPENGLPDGSDWSQPTSDLQRAIETLLASRNGHRKEIRLLDGTYTPIYMIDGHLSFYVDTKYQNASVMLPVRLDSKGDPVKDGNGEFIYDEGYGIKSFIIKGGYSHELQNMYDLKEYPAVFRAQDRTNETSNSWDHLFYINDLTQRYGRSQLTPYNKDNGFGWQGVNSTPSEGKSEVSVIPFQFDGVRFVNSQSINGTKGAAIYYADQTFAKTYEEDGETVKDIVRQDDATDFVARAPLEARVRKIVNYYKEDPEQNPAAEKSDVPTMFYTVDGDPNNTFYELEHPDKFIMSKCIVMNSGTHYPGHYNDLGTSAVYIGKDGGQSSFYNNVFHSNWGNPLVAYGAKLVNNTIAKNAGHVQLYDYMGYNKSDNATSAPATAYNSQAYNSIFWENGQSVGGVKKQIEFFDKYGNLKFDGLSAGKTDLTNTQHETYSTMLTFNSRPDEDAAAYESVLGGGYHLKQTIENSVYNSLSDVTKQYYSPKHFFKRNAFTGGYMETTDYTPGEILDLTYSYNVGLVSDNDNVMNGPNFTDPDNANIEQRDFTLKPSLRLLNKGCWDCYDNLRDFDGDGVYDAIGRIYDYAWLPTTAHDAASKKRFMTTIDLGAYEYQNNLEQVLYVDPNRTTSGLGISWDNSPEGALGKGDLQAAIDLAAVYNVNSGQSAYVFVKGASGTNEGLHTDESITMRNGVLVFGGIRSDEASIMEKEHGDYTLTTINAYITKIRNERAGVASHDSHKTRVNSIRTSNASVYKHNEVSLADGFVVTPNSSYDGAAIVIHPNHIVNEIPQVVLRNVIVSDFDLTERTSITEVADIQDALLYEALIRDCKTATGDAYSTLKLGTGAYAVNVTVDGKTVGADGSSDLNGGNDAASHVYNSLVNYYAANSDPDKDDKNAVKNTFSGYSYPLADKNLNYQLAEGSKQIDQCAATVPSGIPTGLRSFIDYDHDRDLLGNPRKLALGDENTNTLDRGAFETWKIAKDTEANTSAVNYGGNYYPHAGSVVYIEDGCSFVSAHDLEPGYLLVKDGASVYGNGFDVKAAYVAVERDVKAAGNVIALPYDMEYKGFDKDVMAGVATTSVDPTSGVLTQDPFAGSHVYRYNGNERADWQYTFAKESSDCWDDAVGVIPASEGVLYVPNAAGTKVRFTGKGSSMSDYVYTESGVSKTVTLRQYNDGGRDTHANGNTDDKTDFTSKEDMGWNAIGLPYLVSDYKPYETATTAVHGDANDGKYMMHIPHTLWLWFNGTTYRDGTTANGDGGFYSVSSWNDSDWHMANDETARIWMGEGFFTQTATLSETETLTFYRPVAPAAPSPAKLRGNARYYVTDGIRELDKDSNADAYVIATRYFTTNGVQIDKPARDGITIIVDYYSDGSMKSRKRK